MAQLNEEKRKLETSANVNQKTFSEANGLIRQEEHKINSIRKSIPIPNQYLMEPFDFCNEGTFLVSYVLELANNYEYKELSSIIDDT